MHALGAGPADCLAIPLEDVSEGGGSNASVSKRIGLASVEIWAIREERGKGVNRSPCISANTHPRDKWISALEPLELAVFNGLLILLIAFSG